MSSDKLQLTPREVLPFKGPYELASSSPLHLENMSHEHAIAFKIMSLAPSRYLVQPTHGIIEPGRSLGVHIETQPLASKAAIDAFINSKQKFMVKWRTVEYHHTLIETGHTLMEKMEGGPIHEPKLVCSFEGAKAASKGSLIHSPAKEVMIDCYPTKPKPAPASGGPLHGHLHYILLAVAILVLAIILAYIKFGYKDKNNCACK